MYERDLSVQDTVLSKQTSTEIKPAEDAGPSVTNEINIERYSKSIIKDNEYILMIPEDLNKKFFGKLVAMAYVVLIPILFMLTTFYAIYDRSVIWIVFSGFFLISLITTIRVFLISKESALNHQVLKINSKNISFLSRNIFNIKDEINLKGLGITLQRINFDTKDFVGFEIIEKKVKDKNENGIVTGEKIYASLKLKCKNGAFTIGKFASSEEAEYIKKEVCKFASEHRIDNFSDVV